MKEKLVEFKTAQLAKEKGFDWETHRFYEHPFNKLNLDFVSSGINDEYWGDYLFHNWNKGVKPWKPFKECVSAPSQALLQTWLRDVHDIILLVECFLDENDNLKYEYALYSDLITESSEDDVISDTYPGALEQGLYNALKLIKL